MRNKNQVISLLKKELIQFSSSPHEYHTPKNLGITITTKKRIYYQHITFGGPHWGATLEFPENKEIMLSFFSPIKKPRLIKTQYIKEITFHYYLD